MVVVPDGLREEGGEASPLPLQRRGEEASPPTTPLGLPVIGEQKSPKERGVICK